MTVPRKGGRPRKWRSDADRVRAFRARQNGTPQPPALEDALASGDELARALEVGRRLRIELIEAREAQSRLGKDLQVAQRKTKTQVRQLAQLEANVRTLITERDRAVADRDQLAREVAHLRDEVRDLLREPQNARNPVLESPEQSLPRVVRRRLDRDQRRRRTE